MAVYKIFPEKSVTIFSYYPTLNTGLDEILEISKIYYGNVKDVSRALLKFDVGFLSKLSLCIDVLFEARLLTNFIIFFLD
jgi:hypothetical protein